MIYISSVEESNVLALNSEQLMPSSGKPINISTSFSICYPKCFNMSCFVNELLTKINPANVNLPSLSLCIIIKLSVVHLQVHWLVYDVYSQPVSNNLK